MIIKLHYTILLGFLITVSGLSQTPCENGFAGDYPCKGYDLLSNIPVTELTNIPIAPGSTSRLIGNDIWGWTDLSNNKEYAVIGTANSTAFVDVSDPIEPAVLGYLPTVGIIGSDWRDVKIYNNHAFIVSEELDHGMQVFDLTRLRNVTNPPQTFTADAHYTGFGSAHNIVINETEGYAYAVGSNTFSKGIHIVDIRDPLNPKAAGGYADKGYTHDAQVVTYDGPDTDYTGKEILIACNGNQGGPNTVAILDVTDKNNLKFISEIDYQNNAYSHQGWFTTDKKYFILGDELDEQGFGFKTKTIIFDFTDLDNPTFSFDYFGPTAAIDHNGYVKGNTFYVANYTAGMRVIDVSQIDSKIMTEIAYFDTRPENNNTDFNGAWSIYPYFASGNIIISDINRGLFVVGESKTLNTTQITKEHSVSIYPNPANTYVNVKGNTWIKSVNIINPLGQNVFAKNKLHTKQYRIPTELFPSGVYYLVINDAVIKTLVIQ